MKTVLSEEQAKSIAVSLLDGLTDSSDEWAFDSIEARPYVVGALRAVERAVLEAVGGQYDALNRGIIADLAPVNSQPHSYARGAVLEAVDTITALRAFHDRAIGILGAHGALDQGVEVDALTWLADVLTQADGLRARVAELEQEVADYNDLLELPADTEEAVELFEEEVDGRHPIHYAAAQLKQARAQRDAARRELEERRNGEFERILGFLGIDPGDECKRCSGVGRATYGSTATWRGGIGGQVVTVDVCNQCWGSGSASRPWLRAALDRAREGSK